MSSAALMGFARSSSKSGSVRLDGVTIALVLGIVLLGLVMVTSASVSIAALTASFSAGIRTMRPLEEVAPA